MASAKTKTKAFDGTQSFVGTLSSVWSRPSILAFELAWRWLFGGPALALVLFEARRVLFAATAGSMAPSSLGLDAGLMADPVGSLAGDPLAAAGKFAHAFALLAPGLVAVARWLVPLLVLGWIVISGLGRSAVLKRADRRLSSHPLVLMVLQAVRAAALAIMFWFWFAAVSWASRTAILIPVAARQEPNLVLYCALLIVATLGLFTLWGFLGWFFSLAPILAMARDLSPLASYAAAWRIRQTSKLATKLIEINLVMSVVKIALIVLAMVFTATPLPFEAVISGTFLFWWWIGVMCFYVVWSDFFHVARILGYLELYRAYEAADAL